MIIDKLKEAGKSRSKSQNGTQDFVRISLSIDSNTQALLEQIISETGVSKSNLLREAVIDIHKKLKKYKK